MKGTTGYRPDIDGLRALAVLPVVGYHAFPALFPGGFIGVDIFFVISGFLISGIIFRKLEQGSFSSIEFYFRRIRRIFPALILVLFVSFIVGWFVLDAEELKQLGKHIAGGAGFISNFILVGESGYFDVSAEQKPLLHLWSLGIEEQFYIFWPLLLIIVWKYRHDFIKTTLFIAIASFSINIYLLNESVVAAFYSPFSRFWELMVGGILAYIMLHHSELLRRRQHVQSGAGLLLVFFSIVLIDDGSRFPGWWTLMPVAGAFLIISAGPSAWINRRILSSRLLVWIGLISYPLYLWHWPLLTFARIDAGETPAVGVRVLAVALGFLLSWLTYRLLEKPIRQGVLSRMQTITLCVLMMLIGYIGYNAFERDGLEFRHRYDWKAGYRSGVCFIRTDEDNSSPALFSPECGGSMNTAQPTVLLWGDSHAAALYPGISGRPESIEYNLAQFNAGGCPPVLEFSPDGRKVCPEINSYVFEMVRNIKPDTVILAANWLMYSGKEKINLLDYTYLGSTIRRLREASVENIVLVGQLPVFQSAQPKVGKRIFRQDQTDRTFVNMDMRSFDSNDEIKAYAGKLGTGFVSPMELLCNSDGCLISVSRSALVPLAWDTAHLTGHGSALLVDMAIKQGQIILPVSGSEQRGVRNEASDALQ